MLREKHIIIFIIINLLLVLNVLSEEVQVDDNKIIVSGFVINKISEEGIQVNIIVKSALDFKVIQKITSADQSGSYTCKLSNARYYFIVEKKGYEYFNELIDLNKVSSIRTQKDIYLVPLADAEENIINEQTNYKENESINNNVSDNTLQGLKLNIKNGFQHLDIPMIFEKASSLLNENSKNNLKYILDFLQINKDVKLEIRGFSDNGFNNDMDIKTAERRALVVKAYLVSKGINENRLNSVSFPTKKVEQYIDSKKNKRLSHLIEFRIVGNELEEELLLEKLKEDFMKGDYILSEKMQSDLNNEKPVRFNKSILNNDISAGEEAISTKDEIIEETINDVDAFTTSDIESSNNEIENITTSDEVNSNVDKIEIIRNNDDENEISDNGLNNNDSERLNELNYANKTNEVFSEHDDEQVLSAYDKFMKEIDDINKKIIFFDKKNSDINEEYIQVVDSVYEFLRAHPKIDIKITGYASQKEGKSKFMQISIDRSNNVANYLLNKGVKKSIMKIKSGGNFNKRGEDMPIEDEMRVIFYVEQLKQPQSNKNKITGAPPKLRVKKDGEQFGTNISANAGENKYDKLRNESDHIEHPNLKSEGDFYNHLLEEKSDVTKKGLVFKVQVGAYHEPQTKKSKLFKKVKNPEMYRSNDGYVRYFSGQFRTIELAQIHCTKLIKKGIDDAFVIAIYNGDRILMKDLVKIL